MSVESATESPAREPDGPRRHGDVDVSVIGAMLADPRRCKVLMALGDGRALPASVLAAEAGVSPSTASSHLAKLRAAGLLNVERYGRHRYYRLAGPQVGQLLELLAQLAPARPIRSLRQSGRAHALRQARTCYDHLAGRLGVALMGALLDQAHLVGGDGTFHPESATTDRLAGYGHDMDYRLTDTGHALLAEFGIRLPQRPVIRYCVDWSEQRHHLSGEVGRAVLGRLVALDWIRRAKPDRAVQLTDAGRRGLRGTFGLDLAEID